MGWLTGWTYRKLVTLSRASGAVTLYQMKLLVGESGNAVGEDVYCADEEDPGTSHCKSDFSDLRFTTSDGETLLDYWIESISGTTPNQLATVWIEFDSIGTGATTFCMYYGKADAPAVSSGVNTFILFDDFERGNNGDEVGGSWTEVQGQAEISTEQKFSGTRSMKLVGTTTAAHISAPMTASDNISIRLRIYKETASNGWFLLFGNGSYWTGISLNVSEDLLYRHSSGWIDSGQNATPDLWQLIEVNDFVWAALTMDIWLNGSKISNDAAMGVAGASFADVIMLYGDGSTLGDSYVDDVIVRNYRSTEPAWGSWGPEEGEEPAGANFVIWIQ